MPQIADLLREDGVALLFVWALAVQAVMLPVEPIRSELHA